MDVEFDSDLGKIEEVEIIGGTFQPYLYEPVSRNQPESSYDNEPTLITHTFFSSLRMYQIILVRPSFLFV